MDGYVSESYTTSQYTDAVHVYIIQSCFSNLSDTKLVDYLLRVKGCPLIGEF